MVFGIVIPHETRLEVFVKTFTDLASYRAAVGGYIEPISIQRPRMTLFANEEGKVRNLPVNRRATCLWWLLCPEARGVEILVGDVALVGSRSGSGRRTSSGPEQFTRSLFVQPCTFVRPHAVGGTRESAPTGRIDLMQRQRLEPISPWEEKFSERETRALAAAHDIDVAVLDSSTPELLIDAIVNDFAAPRIVPLYDDFRIDSREAMLQPTDAPPATTAHPLELAFTLPCQGAASLLLSTEPRVVSSTQGTSGPAAHFEVLHTVRLSLDAAADEAAFTDAIAQFKSDWFAKIAETTVNANVRVDEHRSSLRAAIEPIVRQRHLQRRLVRAATSALNIPLDRVGGPVPSIPLIPRALTLAAVETAAAAGGNEQMLAADIANALIDLIGSFSTALERMPVTADKLIGEDEESIRDVLLFLLNANWKGNATGETFLGQGKTDILLRWHNRDAFIGECKFWKGEKHFAAGLEQLLDRYTVWRATRVALILFVRDVADITAAIDKAKSTIRNHPRFLGDSGDPMAERPSYLVKAQHDNQQVVTLTLIPVVLPRGN
jgi:hypothetical protein